MKTIIMNSPAFRMLLLCFGLLCSTTVSIKAQNQMNVQEIKSFKKQVLTKSKSIQSFQADFEETEYIDVLQKPQVSNGIMRYKSGLLLWEHTAPKKKTMLFTKDKVILKNSNGRTHKINLNSNQTFKTLQHLMIGGYTGDIFDEQLFSINYYKENENKVMVLSTKKNVPKKLKGTIKLIFQKNEGTVSEIKIEENASNYTIIKLRNKKFNADISDQIFEEKNI